MTFQLYSYTADWFQELLLNLLCGYQRLDWILQESHHPCQLVDICSHLRPAYSFDILCLVGVCQSSGVREISAMVEKVREVEAKF